VLKHAALETLQDGARLQAELNREMRSKLTVCLERFVLPTGAVQREHALGVQTFPQGMPGEKAIQLTERGRVPPHIDQSLDSTLEGRRAELLQPGRDRNDERIPGQVAEHVTPPE
jgi:hypothetical protein